MEIALVERVEWVMKRTSVIMVGALAMLASTTANATVLNNSCLVPSGYRSVLLRSDLPDSLRKTFEATAMPGEHFNTSDAGLPGSGLLFVWNRDGRWIIAIAHGGIAMRFGVLVYQLSDDGKIASSVGSLDDASVPNPCELASSYAK